jgi:hypothetical protein
MSRLTTQIQQITREEKELRKEVSRLCSMANKRLKRLEKSELTSSPAYQSWEENGKHKFSVRGKSYNEVQKEYWRVKNFIENKTSSVTGTREVLKEMATNTGIEYKDIQDLQSKASIFFDLASKVQQYLKSIDNNAVALDYQKIWQQINLYVKDENIDLAQSENDMEMVQQIVDRLTMLDARKQFLETVEEINPTGWKALL